MKHILVVGGGGYIGSHMINYLSLRGVKVTNIDNFSTGYSDAILFGEVYQGSMGDRNMLGDIFSSNTVDAVLHFGSYINVQESVENPGKYYENNVGEMITFLNEMVKYGVKKLIFSSSAAVYGRPSYVPMDEKHPTSPVSPYGKSKFMVEQILEDYDRAYDLQHVCLRYFNAAGAHPDALLGERHRPETHLIPLAIGAAVGSREKLTIFGNNWNTTDGTCVRDYVHVEDICSAHYLSLGWLCDGNKSRVFNIGTGVGYTVKQVIQMVEKVTGCEVPYNYVEGRQGDPPELIADSSLARAELKWGPAYSDLEQIVQHAWNWERKERR